MTKNVFYLRVREKSKTLMAYRDSGGPVMWLVDQANYVYGCRVLFIFPHGGWAELHIIAAHQTAIIIIIVIRIYNRCIDTNAACLKLIPFSKLFVVLLKIKLHPSN